ncbi:hypothetical protein [Streptomyces sp. 6N223]|uniref:hypothetical protein n=1 Tax=Streptomyces sp. 6N223 TaxID=3457412 RepID=UPI003FD3E38B
MISPPIAGAVETLQKQALTSHDTYELDRIDRALDELLRNPADTSTPAKFRIRSAMGHAYEALERRRAIAPRVALDPEHHDNGHDVPYVTVEILAWLRTEPSLSDSDRVLLNDLARGHDAASMAQRHGVPLARMRERISRARRRARKLWLATEATS